MSEYDSDESIDLCFMDEIYSEVATVDLDSQLHRLLDDCPNVRDRLTKDDIQYMEHEMEQEVELYASANILDMFRVSFHEDLIQHVFTVLFSQWHAVGIFEENDGEDVREWIEEVAEQYFESGIIPHRQSKNQKTNREELYLDTHLTEKLDVIKSCPQPEQRTKEWYLQRYNMLTASNAVKIFGTDAAKKSIVEEKSKPYAQFAEEQNAIHAATNHSQPLNDKLAMNWGIKYEPVSVAVYEFLYQEKISMFGCIRHPKYSFIGASPDGIVEKTGRMVEIKNIFNREIDGVPKDAYWVQMQWQMETCDLDECDFVETRFKEFENDSEFYEMYQKMEDGEEESKIMGVMIYMCPRISINMCNMNEYAEHENSAMMGNLSEEANMAKGKYILMPLETGIEREDVNKWIDEQKRLYPQLVLFQTYYWILDEWSCVLVRRNRAWFNTALPIVEDIWKRILKEREDKKKNVGSSPFNTLQFKGNGLVSEKVKKLIVVKKDSKGTGCLINMDNI